MKWPYGALGVGVRGTLGRRSGRTGAIGNGNVGERSLGDRFGKMGFDIVVGRKLLFVVTALKRYHQLLTAGSGKV